MAEGCCTEREEEVELERERFGDVCVAAERWKKALASASSMSSNAESEVDFVVSGRTETICSSFSFRVVRLSIAVAPNECRAEVSDSIIGSTMYLLVPYVKAAAPEAM